MSWISGSLLAILVIGLIVGYVFGRRPQGPVRRSKPHLHNKDLAQLIKTLPTSTRARIEGEWRKGKPIGAIKIFREATNADLKQAKEAVEQMMKAGR